MILPSAPSFAGAALRAMRTAAGRHALRAVLVLVLGGLFALGCLCEGHAHAADGMAPGGI